MWTVYRIAHIPTGKSYIGITGKTAKRRWAAHRGCARSLKNAHYIHNAIGKHGLEAFRFQPLCQLSSADEAVEMERLLISELNTLAPNGYNLTTGGERAKQVSEETRAKLKLIHVGRKWAPEVVERRRQSMIGKPQSQQKSEKIRAAKLGKKRPADFCAKMRAIRLGKSLSPSATMKCANFHRGRKRSEESRQRMRIAQRAVRARERAEGIKRNTGVWDASRRARHREAILAAHRARREMH